MEFLKTRKTKIVDSRGRPVYLRGVNLGGWLLMEGYILHSLNVAEQKFKREFAKHLGEEKLCTFEKDFRGSFIRREDIKKIAQVGFNCIRVPFNYRLVEKRPYQYDLDGVRYLDRVIQWAKDFKLWVILDLHAACGAQNHDWHGDSLGQAELWTKMINQHRTFSLWEFLAERYKNNSTVVGYDLLNEAVVSDERLLNKFYRRLIQTIRQVDRRHILFIEGNRWATDLECLEHFDDDNLCLSIHFYPPHDFVFNFVPQLSYPLKYQGISWNKNFLKKSLLKYARTARKREIPILVGEFGINARGGLYGEDKWLKDVLSCFKELGFHWTYWTYKAVKNSILPDGIYSYRGNPSWVNRQGAVLGWDNYKSVYSQKRIEMIRFWKTESFSPNREILDTLRHGVR